MFDLSQRYDRNKPLISDENQDRLKDVSAAVIGLGGLGGQVSEVLARLGVGNLTLIDGDIFDTSNLNRQGFCREERLGLAKVDVATDVIGKINREVHIRPIQELVLRQEDIRFIEGCDFIFDCLDNIQSRFLLQDFSLQLQVPLIHGSLGGWEGQYAFFTPTQNFMEKMYPKQEETIVHEAANIAPIVNLVAAQQVNLFLKYFLQIPNFKENILYRFNIEDNSYLELDMDE